MENLKVKEEIDYLREQLHKLNHAYYIEHKSLVTDTEFDAMLKKLEELEGEYPEFYDENSPSQRVGGAITKGFEALKHSEPMLSLSNTYNEEELREFFDRVEKGLGQPSQYFCELKYDGVAIALHYKNGKLVRALTRGNGVEGEDITANARTINSIPLVLSESVDVEVRGEIVLPFAAFEALNKQREEQGEALYANPRNTASGSLKLQNSAEVARRGLYCICYSLYGAKNKVKSQLEAMEYMRTLGFNTPRSEDKWFRLCNRDEVPEFLQHWDIQRKLLPFATDGVVLKVNRFSDQQELGFTAKSPKWAIAYKFQAEAQSTQLEDVSYQVGRTGAVTPVAHLKPVDIAGTTIKRASLHNQDQIEKLGLHFGDYVFVEKGGEIIPKITAIDYSKPRGSEAISFISHCPECQTPLVREEGESAHYCNNTKSCPPQVKGRIQHFVSKKALEFENWGGETISDLVDKSIIRDVVDLYRLNREDLFKLDRMAEKSVDNLLLGIERSKNRNLARLIYALGIRFVGEKSAKILAKTFGSLDKLANARKKDLEAIPEIGEKMSDSIYLYFCAAENKERIGELKEFGLVVEEDITQDTSLFHPFIQDKKIVISGTFERIARKDLEAKIEALGGIKSSSITSKTDLLVYGANMGPAKKDKAVKLGIEMLSEDEFLDKIE